MAALIKNGTTRWGYQVAPIHQGESRKPTIPDEAKKLFKRFTDNSYVKVELKDGTVMSTQRFIAGYRDLMGRKIIDDNNFFYQYDGKVIYYIPDILEQLKFKTGQGTYRLTITDGGYLLTIPSVNEFIHSRMVLNCKPTETLTYLFKTMFDLIEKVITGFAKNNSLVWEVIGKIWVLISKVHSEERKNALELSLFDLNRDVDIVNSRYIREVAGATMVKKAGKIRKFKNEYSEDDYRLIGETFVNSLTQIEFMNSVSNPELGVIDSKIYREAFYDQSVYHGIYVKGSKRRTLNGVSIKIEVRAHDYYYQRKTAATRIYKTIKKHLTGLGGVEAVIKSKEGEGDDVVITLTASDYSDFTNANTKLSKLLLGLMLKK